MPMMEYVEGCMVNNGNYSYISGNKMVKELGYFLPWWNETDCSKS